MNVNLLCKDIVVESINHLANLPKRFWSKIHLAQLVETVLILPTEFNILTMLILVNYLKKRLKYLVLN